LRPAFAGIDFGTSNSTVGVVRNGQPHLVALETASMPSEQQPGSDATPDPTEQTHAG